MDNLIAVDTLHQKRQQLLMEKQVFLERIHIEISTIENAIAVLSGKKVWETEPTTLYNDESLDYIKGSIEE